MEQLEPNSHEPQVRELLRLSQTDLTDSAKQRLNYAAEAYKLGLRPEVVRQDPTAAGEAAAKAGYASSELPVSMRTTLEWFKRSEALLSINNPKTRRELVGAWLLKGRAFHRIALQTTGENWLDADRRERAIVIARRAFHSAESALLAQHQPGSTWDRYATMTSRYYGQFELDFGSPHVARSCALSGIARALGAKREHNATTPLAASLTEHSTFTLKHTNANSQIFMRSLAIRRATKGYSVS